MHSHVRMSSPVCYHLHHIVLQDLVGRSADELEMELHVAGTKPSKTTPKNKQTTAGAGETKYRGLGYSLRLYLSKCICVNAIVTPGQYTKD